VGGVFNTFARLRPPPVSALALRGHVLCVAGDFTWAGGAGATNIARWDGANWMALGDGIVGPSSLYPPPTVRVLCFYGNELYAGGTFLRAGMEPANSLARWDGARWLTLGDGVGGGRFSPPSVEALAVANDRLYVGGHFKLAGGKPASDFSIWHFPPRLSIEADRGGVVLAWPAAASKYRLQFKERLAEELWTFLTNAPVAAGNQFRLTNQPSGPKGFYRLSLPQLGTGPE
jgi:hypothetical protein